VPWVLICADGCCLLVCGVLVLNLGSEALLAVQGGAMASFNMAAAMDPNMQLLLLQQQVLCCTPR